MQECPLRPLDFYVRLVVSYSGRMRASCAKELGLVKTNP